MFIIPQHLIDIRYVGCTRTPRSPFAMWWKVESITSGRFFLRKSKDVPKETKLSLPHTVDKGLRVGHGVYAVVGYIDLSF